MSGGKQWYGVTPSGYGEEQFFATSPANAKYQCFKAMREAGMLGGRDGFWRFLTRCVEVRLSDDQGDPRTPGYGVAA